MSAIQIFIHLAWTTLGRRAMIDEPTRAILVDCFQMAASKNGVEILSMGIVKTHVHLLVRAPARLDLPHFLQALKGGSSYVVNRSAGIRIGLRWASEYSATSISPKHLERVRRYVQNQAEHHAGEGIAG